MDYSQFRFPFDKHKGKTLNEMCQTDRKYLDWAISPKGLTNRQDLLLIITSYLHRKNIGDNYSPQTSMVATSSPVDNSESPRP